MDIGITGGMQAYAQQMRAHGLDGSCALPCLPKTFWFEHAVAAPGRVHIVDTPALHHDGVEVSVHIVAFGCTPSAPHMCRTAFEPVLDVRDGSRAAAGA